MIKYLITYLPPSTLPSITEADKYKQYNAGHVPDLIKPGDSAWGTDWLGESKVPSPLRASAPPAGCQRMGHTHAFGSTEEPLRRTVFGCLARGPPSGPRFDHTTGEGHVPFHKGDYHDALRPQEQPGRAALSRVLRGHTTSGGRTPPSPRAEESSRVNAQVRRASCGVVRGARLGVGQILCKCNV